MRCFLTVQSVLYCHLTLAADRERACKGLKVQTQTESIQEARTRCLTNKSKFERSEDGSLSAETSYQQTESLSLSAPATVANAAPARDSTDAGKTSLSARIYTRLALCV